MVTEAAEMIQRRTGTIATGSSSALVAVLVMLVVNGPDEDKIARSVESQSEARWQDIERRSESQWQRLEDKIDDLTDDLGQIRTRLELQDMGIVGPTGGAP